MVLFFESVNKKDLQLQIIVKRNSTKLEKLNSDTSRNFDKLIVISHSHAITKHQKNIFFFAKILRYKKKNPVEKKQFSCKRCLWGTVLDLDKL